MKHTNSLLWCFHTTYAALAKMKQKTI